MYRYRKTDCIFSAHALPSIRRLFLSSIENEQFIVEGKSSKSAQFAYTDRRTVMTALYGMIVIRTQIYTVVSCPTVVQKPIHREKNRSLFSTTLVEVAHIFLHLCAWWTKDEVTFSHAYAIGRYSRSVRAMLTYHSYAGLSDKPSWGLYVTQPACILHMLKAYI